MARGLEDRYHHANPSVARITGTTTTSMIAVELIMSNRSAAAMGPCGLRMPSEQPPSDRVPAKTRPVRAYRMLNLVFPRLTKLSAILNDGSVFARPAVDPDAPYARTPQI